MKKVLERLLTFCIGIPLVVSLAVFFPQCHHLVFNVLIIVLCVLGALEFLGMLQRKDIVVSPVEAAILGALGPVAQTLAVSFGLSEALVPAAFMLGASWCLVSGVFSSTGKLQNVVNRTTGGFAVMVYPGLFMLWITKMFLLPHSTAVLLLFVLCVFITDAAAWAFGMLFGKGNRGFIPASPNKSVMGFIGGLFAATLLGFGALLFMADMFVSGGLVTSVGLSVPLAGAALGFLTGVSACLGDLAESAVKRSVDVKDSGFLLPGRGGILDSIDSISLAAPVYYVCFMFLFV
jgi:phosphatidate cytidylyltransferase